MSRAKSGSDRPPPIIVIFGDDPYQKSKRFEAVLDELIPPEVDRALALTVLDVGTGGEPAPSISAVLTDLATLPFLAERRVVALRSADSFVSEHRERLETYAAAPARTGILVLECRAFARTTRLFKAVESSGGRIVECKKLGGRAVVDFVIEQATARGKRLDRPAATHLVDLVGGEAGLLESEIEKLALYVDARRDITAEDVAALVGQSREEKVFAAMDAAAAGDARRALALWHQVLETDRGAAYKAAGGVAHMLRKWLYAHRLLAERVPLGTIAERLWMSGRERELDGLLKRVSARAIRRYLAALADLDSQAKQGLRSIEHGVELLLVRLAMPAA